MGWQLDAPKGKYESFCHMEKTSRLFAGENGALRIGSSATSSSSVGHPTHQTKFYLKVLAEGDKALGYTPKEELHKLWNEVQA